MHRCSSFVLHTHDDRLLLANDFHSFFTNKISQIRQTPYSNNTCPVQSKINGTLPELLHFKITSPDALSNLLLFKAMCKTCSQDSWPVHFFTTFLKILVHPFTDVVNESLVFPYIYKFRKSNHSLQDMKYYRSVPYANFFPMQIFVSLFIPAFDYRVIMFYKVFLISCSYDQPQTIALFYDDF